MGHGVDSWLGSGVAAEEVEEAWRASVVPYWEAAGMLSYFK